MKAEITNHRRGGGGGGGRCVLTPGHRFRTLDLPTLHRSVVVVAAAAAYLTLPALAPCPALSPCSSSVEVTVTVDEYMMFAVKHKLMNRKGIRLSIIAPRDHLLTCSLLFHLSSLDFTCVTVSV